MQNNNFTSARSEKNCRPNIAKMKIKMSPINWTQE
jgi:hypothetical protein